MYNTTWMYPIPAIDGALLISSREKKLYEFGDGIATKGTC
jgi:hypothetical protein